MSETPNPLTELWLEYTWALGRVSTPYQGSPVAESEDKFRAALEQVKSLVGAADELRLWEPGRKGYAAAQDRLFATLVPFAAHENTDPCE